MCDDHMSLQYYTTCNLKLFKNLVRMPFLLTLYHACRAVADGYVGRVDWRVWEGVTGHYVWHTDPPKHILQHT